MHWVVKSLIALRAIPVLPGEPPLLFCLLFLQRGYGLLLQCCSAEHKGSP